MSNSIATKKYVKAIIESFEGKELSSVEDIFSKLSSLFSVQKFSNIVHSPDVSTKDKKEFLLSIIGTDDKKISNLISLLCENGRLDLIPSIDKELKFQIAKQNNSYLGKIISDSAISKEQITTIEKKLSDKFGATIKLESIISDYPGVKVEVDNLGVETSFSLDRLKAQITEHILKAI